MTKTELIEMSRYIMADAIHEKCVGCEHVFEFTGPESEVVEEKCRVYPKPSAWWEEKPVAMRETLVRSRENPRGVLKLLPAKEFKCPMATHVSAEAAVEGKKRVGQQKQRKG